MEVDFLTFFVQVVDYSSAKEYADQLGIPFLETSVCVPPAWSGFFSNGRLVNFQNVTKNETMAEIAKIFLLLRIII